MEKGDAENGASNVLEEKGGSLSCRDLPYTGRMHGVSAPSPPALRTRTTVAFERLSAVLGQYLILLVRSVTFGAEMYLLIC